MLIPLNRHRLTHSPLHLPLHSPLHCAAMIFLLCLLNLPAVAQQAETTTDAAIADTSTNTVTADPSIPVPAPAPKIAPVIEVVSASSVAPAPYYSAAGSSNKVGSGSHLLSVTMALLFIVALIFAVSWFMRRFGQGVFSNTAQMKVIATMPLGTRERIMLIDVGGQQLLLGVTATNINTLHVFAEPVVLATNNTQTSDFSSKLMALLQQKNNQMQQKNNQTTASDKNSRQD
jgi:flagellar protein FliO/FliZ